MSAEFRFDAVAIMGALRYRNLPVIPKRLNPFRKRAFQKSQAVCQSFREHKGSKWSIEDSPVEIYMENSTVKDVGRAFEFGWECSLSVVAYNRDEAQEYINRLSTNDPAQIGTGSGETYIDATPVHRDEGETRTLVLSDIGTGYAVEQRADPEPATNEDYRRDSAAGGSR